MLPTCWSWSGKRVPARLVAVVDTDAARLRHFVAERGYTGRTFGSLEEYLAADICRNTMVVTPTIHHRPHAMALVRAGHRVLLEKPLTGTLEGDIACCEELDRQYPDSLMLAFQRRYDGALAYGRELMHQGDRSCLQDLLRARRLRPTSG